jgi:hypothetical protein
MSLACPEFPYRGMQVFRTGLVRKEHEFFGTIPIGIHVSNQFQALNFQFAETEIRDFDPIKFACGQLDVTSSQTLRCSFLRIPDLASSHGLSCLPYSFFSLRPAGSDSLRFAHPAAIRLLTSAGVGMPLTASGFAMLAELKIFLNVITRAAFSMSRITRLFPVKCV